MSPTKSVLLAMAAVLAAPVRADDEPRKPDAIELKGGDVLRGRIVSVDAGHITIESGLFGPLAVPLTEVADISSAVPVRLTTRDGRTVDATIERLEGGTLRFADAGGSVAVAVDDLVLRAAADRAEAAAQDAADAADDDSEWSKWNGSVGVGVSLFTGNTERRNASVSAEAVRETDIDRTTLGFSWNYADDKDPVTRDWTLTQRRTLGRGKYDYKLSECDYVFVNVSAENDRFQALDLRLVLGGGYGRTIFDGDGFKLNAEAGVSYVGEDRRVGRDSEFAAGRGAYALEWRIRDGFKFLQDVEALLSLEDADDFFLRKASRLQVTLTESLFSELRWELDYDNTPSPGLDRIDNRVFLQVGYTF